MLDDHVSVSTMEATITEAIFRHYDKREKGEKMLILNSMKSVYCEVKHIRPRDPLMCPYPPN